jgi:hypothetical protein
MCLRLPFEAALDFFWGNDLPRATKILRVFGLSMFVIGVIVLNIGIQQSISSSSRTGNNGFIPLFFGGFMIVASLMFCCVSCCVAHMNIGALNVLDTSTASATQYQPFNNNVSTSSGSQTQAPQYSTSQQPYSASQFPASIPAPLTYCNRCGRAVPVGSAFCPACGTQLAPTVAQAALQPAVYSQPAAVSNAARVYTPPAPTSPTYSNPQYAAPAPPAFGNSSFVEVIKNSAPVYSAVGPIDAPPPAYAALTADKSSEPGAAPDFVFSAPAAPSAPAYHF